MKLMTLTYAEFEHAAYGTLITECGWNAWLKKHEKHVIYSACDPFKHLEG